jgi:hypothetical protein
MTFQIQKKMILLFLQFAESPVFLGQKALILTSQAILS